eukprot:TRINITY_DN32770_c0_g3_i1.p1 TRINITY_DN32770_c0_g3~~TRINITY_DN32770_c0_g3_i1.p1  ORF type:complete len:334 (+),score=92.86 TRINITY_DN32770_c0_g3_i1:107-1108(+)
MTTEVAYDVFERPTIKPEAEQWRQQMADYKAALAAKEQRRADEEAAKEAEVQKWNQALMDAEAARDAAEKFAEETRLKYMKEAQDIHWNAVQRTTELEDSIVRLEKMIEDERASHENELLKQAEILEQARQEFESQRLQAAKRHAEELAAANVRARDAEELSEVLQKRANDEVMAAKAREDKRVAQVRAEADAHMKEFEAKMREKVELMERQTVERHRAMEESMLLHGRRKEDAVNEARTHLAAMEQALTQQRIDQEAEFAMKQARLDEWKGLEAKHNEDLVKHHKGLLDLEQSLHARTMERTIDRVTRCLKVGTDDMNAEGAPTVEPTPGPS